jgi:hypothetical protein
MTKSSYLINVDVGPYPPLGSSPIQRLRVRGFIAGLAIADVKAVEQNLEGLSIHVPNATVDQIPMHYQCHIVDVSASIGLLLYRVAREIDFYGKQHP